ncbi:MAG: hypothetical protein HGA97_04140 [Chlorobiaceae bacterium]|nr:hypothetical protein [Chlorobiaceae bacterium]
MAIDTTEQKTGNQLHLAYEKGKRFFDTLFNRPADTVVKEVPAVKESEATKSTDEETIKWPLPEKNRSR